MVIIQFRSFQKPEDVRHFASTYYSDEQLSWLDLDNKKYSALSDYKGGCYHQMNECLRLGITKCENYDIEGLQALLMNCELPENIITFRYISIGECISIWLGTTRGKTYCCPTFLSTTLLPKYYNMTDIKSGRLLINISVPKGYHGMYISEVNPGKPEYEVLLPHHTKLKRNGLHGYIVV